MVLEPWLGPAAAIGVLTSAGAAALTPGLGARIGRARLPEGAVLLALAFILCGAAASWLAPNAERMGLGLRLDVVSVMVGGVVTFIGFATLRFARVQLRGEPGAEAFLGWLCLCLAAGLLTVFADHLALVAVGWITASLSLHAPIQFRRERPASRRAAHRKFWIDRLSEALLIGAILVLVRATGAWTIGAITAGHALAPTQAILAAALIATAAVLRSAQPPFHGWLLDLLEAPTPVSAVLHAGLISAGGLLLLRLSPVMTQAPLVMAVVALIGGAGALLAGLIQITQPAAKTALVWSTIAQMGFMLLECGLGLYPLALLHILAHGLYKAHAFLWASSAVEEIATARRLGAVAAPGPRAVAIAMLVALGGYLLADGLLGGFERPLQAHALGAILVFGVGYLLAQGLADKAPIGLSARLVVVSLLVFAAYFGLQAISWRITAPLFAPPPRAGLLEGGVVALALVSFGALAVLQAALPRWSHARLARRLRVHLANGLYLDLFLGNRPAPRAPALEA